MKKLLISLGIIVLVAILGVSIVFAYGSYKDLELKKEEAKLEHKKSKDKQKENYKETQQTNNDEQATMENITAQQVESSQQADNTTETRSKNDEIPDSVYSLETDYDGDGVISREEMTPEQEKLFKEGKFQPAIPLKEQREANKAFPSEKVENSNGNSENWDEQAAYEAQKKMYEKAARGEIPEPGASYNQENETQN